MSSYGNYPNPYLCSKYGKKDNDCETCPFKKECRIYNAKEKDGKNLTKTKTT